MRPEVNVIIQLGELTRLSDRIEALENCLVHAVTGEDDWRQEAGELLNQDEEAGELQPQEPEVVQCPNCGRTDTVTPLELPEEPANHYHHCQGCGHVWSERDAQ
jgi:DNA-directed RNA polymerase subunit M/transcription elongation factor TFIIS